jgi:Ca-activated chloride channel family protein
MLRALALVLALTATPARACETALLLAVDISGSIDTGEYAVQMQGLAAALSDPEVAEVLVAGQVALGVVHWSGMGRQALVLPWQRMLSPGHVSAFAERARALPRAFTASDTAVGEAIAFSAAQFAAVQDCRRRIIDISGDGPENTGFTVSRARQAALAQGIEINAIAIEEAGSAQPVTRFYRDWVISPGGFVMTARTIGAYPATLRAKIIRELLKPAS